MQPHEHYEASLDALNKDHERRRDQITASYKKGPVLQNELARNAWLMNYIMDAMYAYYFMPTVEPARWDVPPTEGDNGSETK